MRTAIWLVALAACGGGNSDDDGMTDDPGDTSDVPDAAPDMMGVPDSGGPAEWQPEPD